MPSSKKQKKEIWRYFRSWRYLVERKLGHFLLRFRIVKSISWQYSTHNDDQIKELKNFARFNLSNPNE